MPIMIPTPMAMNSTAQPSAMPTRFRPSNETRAIRGAREPEE
jgi:hypothetical protein